MASRPPPRDIGSTVVMSVQSIKLPAPERAPTVHRLWYLVRPAADRWEVVLPTSECVEFATFGEALLAARATARECWSSQGQPTGVNVDEAGKVHFAALYGRDAVD
jgi:hypothetical protein